MILKSLSKQLIIALFLVIKFTTVLAQEGMPTKALLSDNVGDIAYNPQTDKPLSFLQGDNRIFWYYSVNTTYVGGKKAMLKTILAQYKYRPLYKNVTGYVTIKFVVNNKGDTDRFRIFQVDSNYKQSSFPPTLLVVLKNIISGLKEWIPGKYHDGTPCNSYYYLNFKMEKGKIVEVTP